MEDVLFKILFKLSDMKVIGSAKNDICKHWSSTAVFTGKWMPPTKGICDPGLCRGKRVKEEKLLQGELAAYTCRVGCYMVRSAIRVYKISELGYCPEEELPASAEEMEMIRKDIGDGKQGVLGYYSWNNKFRIANEISAKYEKDSRADFTYICRAAHARNYSWSETISCICAAKQHLLVPDKRAFLFVCNTYLGDSFSADTWYKLNPEGKIKRMRLHPYDENMENARFT